ncbi:hypothetical protein [Aeromicrobium sp. UC242_57]|uniref:hypothetical protein n=1 Tax=Aeromicrobium sp. UC242_57 TaxID=3374624 RepID=UPI003791B187
MRSKIGTAMAAFVTTAVVMASATMALAAEADPVDPDTVATSPSPSATTPTPDEPTDSEPTEPEPTSSTPTPTPSPTLPATTRVIDDAQLRWGINNESNNKAFAPGTFNFLSAGKIGDPGEGNKQISTSDQGATWNNGKAADWKASDGNVALEKFTNKTWKPATFAGLRTTSAGETMNGNNGFSNHEVVLSGGTGTVDRTKRTASVQWTGSFTVVYYSGYSFFYVSDPKLTVSGGSGSSPEHSAASARRWMTSPSGRPSHRSRTSCWPTCLASTSGLTVDSPSSLRMPRSRSRCLATRRPRSVTGRAGVPSRSRSSTSRRLRVLRRTGTPAGVLPMRTRSRCR